MQFGSHTHIREFAGALMVLPHCCSLAFLFWLDQLSLWAFLRSSSYLEQWMNCGRTYPFLSGLQLFLFFFLLMFSAVSKYFAFPTREQELQKNQQTAATHQYCISQSNRGYDPWEFYSAIILWKKLTTSDMFLLSLIIIYK